MLANSHSITSGNEKADLATFVAIPIDTQKTAQERDQLKVIQNLFIKQFADGSICLVQTNEDKQLETQMVVQEQHPVTFTTTSITNNDLQRTLAGPVRSRTILLQPPLKKPEIKRSPPQTSVLKKLAPKQLEKKYKCIKCDNLFDTLILYRDHMKWHKCQKKFKCSKCFAGYNIENNLKIHMILTHSEECNTKCPICDVNLTFQRAASMKSHLMLHQVEEYYSCEDCGWEFDKEDDFMKHMETHAVVRRNEPKPLTCPHCKVKFGDAKKLRLHVSDHVKLNKTFCRPKRPRKPGAKKESNHVCSVCNKSFIKNSLLERHERIHSGEKPFKCQFCDRGFTQKGTLQIHLSRHTGVKPYSCTLCPAKFYQKGNLRVHIQKTHTFPGEDQKMYKCSQCTCIFKKIATLNGHVTKAHLNSKDTVETEDGIIDDVMMRLKELEKQTSGNVVEEENTVKEYKDPPQEIEADDELNELDTYIQKGSLVQLRESINDGDIRKYVVRQKKIDDVRWYFCNHCSKKFKKPSDLIRHIRVHTREKPFKCKQCKTAFSLKSTLMSHMRTHKSNSDYKCKACNSVFSSLRVLNAHLRKHDFDSLPKWQCITCGFLFDELEKGYKHREEKGRERPHIIQPFIHRILKQPLYQTTYGSLIFKPPKPRFPNTGLESPTVRPFHCAICDARFTRRVNLKRHIQFHNGDRKYKCHLCPKAFITSYRLTEHLNYHNNIKNYICTVCGKRFVTSSLLKRHVIIHNTHRPYQCPYCDKTFKTLLLCRTHIRQVHKKEVIPKLKSESESLMADAPSDSQKFHTTADFIPNQGRETISTLQSVPESLSQQDISLPHPPPPSLRPNPESQIIQQNSIQILNPNVDDIQSTNDYQTIYVNIDEMPFLDNSNLTLNSVSLQPQLKLQNTDSLLLNQIDDLQDNNIIFNIDSLKSDLDLPPVEIFTSVNNENDVPVTTTLPSIAEISTKTINLNFAEKNLNDKTSNLNPLLGGNTTLFPNVTFTDELSLPISVVEGDNGFDSNTTVTIFQTSDSTNLSHTDDIYETTNIMCINCNRVFTSLDIFQDHSCTLLGGESVKTGTEDLKKTEETSDNNTRGTLNETDKSENSETVNNSESEEKLKGALKCHICKKLLANKFSLDRHVISHSARLKFECSLCKKTINGRSAYVKHLASHDNSNDLRSCKYCFKDFKKPSDLKRHLRTHTGEKPFGCHLCDKKFSLKSTLESHIKTHDPSPKQYSCNICNSFFSSKSSLKVHMTIHTGHKPHSCSFCDQKFRTAGNRKSHESLMHLSKKKKSGERKQKITDMLESVASEVLNNVNNEDNNLDNAKEKDILPESLPSQIVNLIEPSDNLLPTLCEDQVSIDPAILLQQLRMSGVILTNDNESLILDDITLLNIEGSKDNTQIISLPSTQQTQSNLSVSNNSLTKTEKTRSLECDICHKTYASKDVLRKHKRNIHGINKKFPCIKCDKAFGTQDDLNKHLKLHSGYRPYSCLYCANSFTEEHSLKTHMKRIHQHVNVAKETTSALLNMKFDLPSANIDEPLFNNLFAKKDSIILLE